MINIELLNQHPEDVPLLANLFLAEGGQVGSKISSLVVIIPVIILVTWSSKCTH